MFPRATFMGPEIVIVPACLVRLIWMTSQSIVRLLASFFRFSHSLKHIIRDLHSTTTLTDEQRHMSQLTEAQFSQALAEFVVKFNANSNEKWTFHKVGLRLSRWFNISRGQMEFVQNSQSW